MARANATSPAQAGLLAPFIEAFDAANIKLMHLDAALAHTLGDSFDSFDSLASHVKADYLSLCWTLAHEALQLLHKLGEVEVRPGAQGG